MPPFAATVIARTPSHLNSYAQPATTGSSPVVASMGRGTDTCSTLRPGTHRIRSLTLAPKMRCWYAGVQAARRRERTMRAIWKGAVSFGLVSISVKLFSATEEKDIRFHQVHRTDGGRIRYKRTCSICGEEVTYDDIAKGYDLGGGEIVVLTDEDFADLPLTTSRAIDVLEFVPQEQVDPIYYNKSYFLEPDKSAAKPYVLLRDALERTDRVAVVKVALRQREQLATLRVRDGVMVRNTMLWPDEVGKPNFEFLG